MELGMQVVLQGVRTSALHYRDKDNHSGLIVHFYLNAAK